MLWWVRNGMDLPSTAPTVTNDGLSWCCCRLLPSTLGRTSKCGGTWQMMTPLHQTHLPENAGHKTREGCYLGTAGWAEVEGANNAIRDHERILNLQMVINPEVKCQSYNEERRAEDSDGTRS